MCRLWGAERIRLTVLILKTLRLQGNPDPLGERTGRTRGSKDRGQWVYLLRPRGSPVGTGPRGLISGSDSDADGQSSDAGSSIASGADRLV